MRGRFKDLKDKASAKTPDMFRSSTMKSKPSSSKPSLNPSEEYKQPQRDLRRSQTAPTGALSKDTTILRITIHKAKDLLALDNTGTSDPYIVFGLVSSKKRYKTKTIQKNCNPVWEETVTVKLKKRQGTERDFIIFELTDKDFLTKDDPLGIVKVPIHNLKMNVPFQEWYDVQHPSDSSKKAGKLQVTLKKSLADGSSMITKSLRNKMFATLTVTQMKLREWGVEAEISVEVVFGIFKMTLAVGAQATEKNLDELQMEMNELRREIANTPTDEEEENEEIEDTSGEKKLSRFEKVLVGSMDKLRTALSVSKAQFIERGLFGSVGAGICFHAYAIEFEVMLTIAVHSSETVYVPQKDDEEKSKG